MPKFEGGLSYLVKAKDGVDEEKFKVDPANDASALLMNAK